MTHGAVVGSSAVAGFSLAPRSPAVPLETVAVREAVPTVDATAQLVPHTWGTEIKLVGSGFEEGDVYTVSVTAVGGRRVGAGEFLGTGDAEMRCNLNSSVLRPDATGFQVLAADGTVVIESVF
ncbi:MAG: hypothetical protein H7Y15_10880 [Pseudonocardia sp.]|nr:hypothetical protein [Pseudonocardia sp.]